MAQGPGAGLGKAGLGGGARVEGSYGISPDLAALVLGIAIWGLDPDQALQGRDKCTESL